jgi:hypothetical protein
MAFPCYVSCDDVDFANVYAEHIMTRVTESHSFLKVLILMFGTCFSFEECLILLVYYTLPLPFSVGNPQDGLILGHGDRILYS